jgi:hypothetical protein
MMRSRIFLSALWLVGVMLVLTLSASSRTTTAQDKVEKKKKVIDPAAQDLKHLSDAKIPADDASAMIQYLKSRILTEPEIAKIQAVILRMGAESFDERQKASVEAEKFGPAAVTILRKAALIDPSKINDTDFEIASRADEVLKKLEKVLQASVARACIRTLAKLPHAETVQTLLGYSAVADNPQIAEEIQRTLTALAVRDGKPDALLVETLKDRNPRNRVIAARALLEGGAKSERIRIPEAYPKVVEAAKSEANPEAKFAMIFSLATISRDVSSIGTLIDMLPEVNRGQLWQTEDFLLLLAGAEAPKATLGATTQSLKAASKNWQEWWQKAQGKLDLDKWTYTARLHGTMLMIVHDNRSGGGYVCEVGSNLQETWRVGNGRMPYDAVKMPDGNIAIADLSQQISIRDSSGLLVSSIVIGGVGVKRFYGQPQQIQLLADGRLVAVSRNNVVEIKPDGEQRMLYERANNYDICAAICFPNNEIGVLIQNVVQGPNVVNGQGEYLVIVDAEGKEIADKKIKTGQPYYQAHMAVTGPDRVLISEQQQIAEYELKTKKAIWSKPATMVMCLQRLPNGNTLYVDNVQNAAGSNRVVEVAPNGDEVWSMSLPNGQRIHRAYRQ